MSYDKPRKFEKPRPCKRCENGIAKNGARVCGKCRRAVIDEEKEKFGHIDLPLNTGAVRFNQEMRGRSMLNVGFDKAEVADAIHHESTAISDDDCGPLIVMKAQHKPDDPRIDE